MEKFPNNKPKNEKEAEMKPHHIRKAQLEGDTQTLSASGRKGGQVAGERRRADRVMNDMKAERLQQELYDRAAEANEIDYPPSIYD